MKNKNTYQSESAIRTSQGIGVKDGLTFLLVGGGIGALLALLFAPKSGSELRGDIAEVTRKGYDATLDKGNYLRTRSSDTLQSAKKKARRAYDFSASKVKGEVESIADVLPKTLESDVDGLDAVRREDTGNPGHSGIARKSGNIV